MSSVAVIVVIFIMFFFLSSSSDNPVSVKVLFQAVQSHLYFSQLSAWLNRTCGKSPRNISYR